MYEHMYCTGYSTYVRTRHEHGHEHQRQPQYERDNQRQRQHEHKNELKINCSIDLKNGFWCWIALSLQRLLIRKKICTVHMSVHRWKQMIASL
jgi:hypothetical protein